MLTEGEKVCPTEEAAIRIVPPDLVRGRIGEHYRLGWKSQTSITQEFTPAEQPDTGDTAPALNYLNQDDKL